MSSGSPVGIQPTRPLIAAAPADGVFALRLRRPHRGDADARMDVGDGHVDELLEAEDDVDAVEADITRANGSVSVWPGYCTGVTIV